MGNFASTLFSVLLGWVQSIIAWLWKVIGADGADGLMGWMVDHWLALTIVLCVIGLSVDLVVYIFRWQPYRVWRNYWKRGGEDPQEEAPQESAGDAYQWVYANGETVPETWEAQPEEEAEPQPQPRVIPARRRRSAYVVDGGGAPDAQAQARYHQPYYPPQWNADDNEPDDGGTQA